MPEPLNLRSVDAGPLSRTPANPSRAAAGRTADAVGGSFAASLARAETPTPPATPLTPPPGEKWESVPGRANYADIVSGPRNGLYVNLMDGPRRGQAFHIVHRESRTFHVYGEGRDRTVVEVKRQEAPDRLVEPRPGESWRSVAGHGSYRRIEGGDRDGLYINLSGNDRHGETFTIERRNGHAHHVYDSGPVVHVTRRDPSGASRAH